MPSYRIITDEIPVKGIGYLIVNESEDLRAGVDALMEKGATVIFAKGPLEEGEREGLRITHTHDMLRMERGLTELPAVEEGLRLEGLSRAQVPGYIEIYNECFQAVPNAATVQRSEAERFLVEESMAGLVRQGERVVGFYDCDLRQEIPVIEGLGLLKEVRGRGLGRELLRAVLARLAERGYKRCQLTVATSNIPALALYREEGFTAEETLSSWYAVRHCE